MVNRFQAGEAPVFLLSLKAAGTGLNLTRAGHVVHFDRWWNPAVEAQATDRAYRIGQTQPVQVHRLIAEGTIEDRIAEMLARKQGLADAVLGSGETALTELTDAELADLVELRGAHDERHVRVGRRLRRRGRTGRRAGADGARAYVRRSAARAGPRIRIVLVGPGLGQSAGTDGAGGRAAQEGRRLAREGRVGAVSVRPGRITAVVQDRDSTRYRSDVLLPRLSEEEWDRFLDMAVQRSGHIAALLDREMPPHLVEDAAAAGVDLLPGIGDLEPECSCEAWDHCPHSGPCATRWRDCLTRTRSYCCCCGGATSAGCWMSCRPAAPPWPPRRHLMLPRRHRRGRQEHRARCPGRRGVCRAGHSASAARSPPLPPSRALCRRWTRRGSGTGRRSRALEVLAADSAVRAYRMLADALTSGHEHQPLPVELTPDQDAVRLTAETRPGPQVHARLAAASGGNDPGWIPRRGPGGTAGPPHSLSSTRSGSRARRRRHGPVHSSRRHGRTASARSCGPYTTGGR
ncbi:helicase-related protein [Streptomyces sp. M10(2022)]